MKKRPLKVLWLPVDEGGCGWYRVRQWHEAFELRDDVQSVLCTGKEKELLELIENADVIVTRQAPLPLVKKIKEDIDPLKPIVFDSDDNTMVVLPTSEHYQEYGTEDAWVKKGEELKPVWVTGHTKDFNRFKNLWGQMGLLYLLGVADLITAPVGNLLEFYMQYASQGSKGAIVPNCLNLDLYPEGEFIPSDKKKGEIRIGWHGGVSHLGDWEQIGGIMGKVLEDFPEVRVHIMGSYYKNQFKGFKDKITYHPWTPFKGYTYRLKTIGLDGAVIPLENQPFNLYKSEIKFTELSQLGIPCLISKVGPYAEVCKGGKNSWTFAAPEDFEEHFRDMLKDLRGNRSKSKRYVKKAQQWVRKNRIIEDSAGRLIEVYKSILPEEVRNTLL